MIDGKERLNGGFEEASKTEKNLEFTLGIEGLWLVGRGNDYFEKFEDKTRIGIEVFNSCGSSIVAVNK